MAIQEKINIEKTSLENKQEPFTGKEAVVSISKYLDENLVVFLDVQDRNQALEALVDCLEAQKKISDKQTFYQAILEREKIVSTGIGLGVAIPHAKIHGYSDFFIAIGIQSSKGIEWNALDGSLVHLIFMIGGPEDRQTEYLKILSRLTIVIKEEERRKKLLQATKPKQVIDLFQGC